jgi:MOSC domain-containing protein YiiM
MPGFATCIRSGPKTTGLHGGLVGDQIFDIEHHGGDDQAVYAYAREDYDWWQARLSRRLANGLSGENRRRFGRT